MYSPCEWMQVKCGTLVYQQGYGSPSLGYDPPLYGESAGFA